MKNILKNTNGSVLEPLEVGQEYFHISRIDASIIDYKWDNSESDFVYMKNYSVFLTRRDAEKALEQIKVKFRLTKKIKEIDRENNWICDWSSPNQIKYILFFEIQNNRKIYGWVFDHISDNTYMSEQAKDYMMSDEVSIKDFKLFVGIIDEEQDNKKSEYLKLHDELMAKAMELKAKANELKLEAEKIK